PAHGPGLISAERLAAILTEPNLRIIDTRPQPEYNTSHAPGAVALNPESLRGVVGGIPSMLLPADLLARQFGALGISPETHVVIIHGDKVHDATLVAMGLERLGHTHYSILDGGWQRWHAEGRPSDTRLPRITETVYPVPPADGFTVGAETVLAASGDGATRIIDVRPAPFFTGKASDEARAGHIPGAVNRPYTLDLASGTAGFASISDLAKTYESFVPMRDSRVIVHCRTGHQASQTWFVLRRLLGYTNVLWYDAGWTEWSARPELPVATGNK
ncbi:MAG TPA: rhodanese-like domain-containing protein, partial [Candidatus Ozemobacteraceae bacterium]